MKSYSPLYVQTRMWIAEYQDGSTLKEWEPSGNENLWQAINFSKFAKLHLVSDTDDDFFDARNGFFIVDKKHYIFPLAGFPLKFKPIQYKDAHTHFIATPAGQTLPKYAGFGVEAYHIGWETQKEDIKVKVILRVQADAIKKFLFEMTFLDIKRKFGYELRVA